MEQAVILCVDDEKIILNSLKGLLWAQFRDRFLYEMAESAEEGLEVLDEISQEGHQVELVICDWVMPGMKGGEFLLQVEQEYPEAKKILLTGQADEKAVAQLKEKINLSACLLKPWKNHQLLGLIEQELMVSS